MSLVFSENDSGLVVAEQSADERSVRDALRDHDRALRLVRGFSEEHGCWVWRVYRYAGPDRPAEFLCDWSDRRGTPFPLSHRLVDYVRHELDKNGRAPGPDPDRRNAELVERRRKDADADMDEAAREHAKAVGRLPLFHRSPGLTATRRRLRREGREK